MSECSTVLLFNCGTRARGNYSRLEVEAFGTHQVDRTDRLFCPQTSALSPNVHSLTFSIVDNLTFYIALHCAGCPLAVQTSPYFLFNSFASRKSDSNTSPRKHKYASLGTAFHIGPALRRNSDLKWGFPESINMLLPRLCLTFLI